jgi:murein DD-endopeptidase MepM/ murein hydrolase activator NlpD
MSRGEAAMTAWSLRATLIGLTATGLAGCIDARSQYAPYEGYKSPPPSAPMRPQYPVSEQAAPAPALPAAPPAAADPSAPKAAPSHQVGSEGLPPARTPSAFHGDNPMLVPLVWRPDAEPVAQVEVVHHHHQKLRPEIDQEPAAESGHHGRHKTSKAKTKAVVVHKGDTIKSIAERTGTSPRALMKANKVRHPRDLTIGDILMVPTEEEGGRGAATTRSKTYVIRRGDTLYSLARRYGVSVDDLRSANGFKPSSPLHAGQKIEIPGQPGETEAVRTKPSRSSRAERSRIAATPPTRSSTMASSAFESAPVTSPPRSFGQETATAEGPSRPIPYASLQGQGGMTSVPPPPARPSASYTIPTPGYTTATPPPSYAPPATAPSYPSPSPQLAAPPVATDAQIAAAGRGLFIWPVQGAVLSGFGPLPGGQRNDGLDITAPDGTPVRAAASGDVVYAGNLVPGFGNLVLVKHNDGWVTAYAHLSRTEVKIKDHIAQGTEIGAVGSSGGVAQPELHFEVRYAPSPRERARPIDPTLVLPSATAAAANGGAQ